jgi:lycopene epsilon-cyclase
VFLEETCLASSVQMPFDELKRRLYMRLARMGLDVDIEGGAVIEEEASWIPLGGPLPRSQRNIAFGAAACMVHPASGYSITNSLRQAKILAATMAEGLKDNGCVAEAANSAWEVLWSPEKKRRMAFYQFGMQLIAGLKISELRSFFVTFYALPRDMHQKFLSMDLTSLELLMFAVAFFVNGTNRLRQLLVLHLAAPAGSRFLKIYLDTFLHQFGGGADALAAATQENASKTMIRRSEGKMVTPSAMTVEKQQMGERAGLSCGYMAERKDVKDVFGKEAPFDVDMRPSESGST